MDNRTPNKRQFSAEDSGMEVNSPRKYPKRSFWSSNKVQKPVVSIENVELESLKAGERVRAEITVRVLSKRRKERILILHIMDKSGERTMKAFGNEMEQFQKMEIGEVYKVNDFKVTAGWHGGDNELMATYNTKFDKVEATDFPQVSFDFVSLDMLPSLDDGSVVDVCGIILFVNDAIKTSQGIDRREIQVTDRSKSEPSVFFWREDAVDLGYLKEKHPIVLRHVRKSTYGTQTTLNVSTNTQIFVTETIKEAGELKKWFDMEVEQMTSVSAGKKAEQEVNSVVIDDY